MDAVNLSMRIFQILRIVLTAALSVAEVEVILVVKDDSTTVMRSSLPFGGSDNQFFKGSNSSS